MNRSARSPGWGRARLAASLLFPLLVLCLAGCAGLGGSSGAPTLSDAMREAARDTPVGTEPADSSGYAVRPDNSSDSTGLTLIGSILDLIIGSRSHASATEPAPPFETTPGASSEHRHWLRLGAGTALMRSDLFEGIRQMDLRYGMAVSDRVRLGLSAGIGWSPVNRTGPIAASLEAAPMLLNAGGTLAWQMTPRHTLFGLSLLASIGLDRMSWEYRNPVTLSSAAVYDDAIYGLDLSAGVGITLVRGGGLELTGEIAPGVMLWYPSTEQGFRNDLFDPMGYVRVGMVVGLGM